MPAVSRAGPKESPYLFGRLPACGRQVSSAYPAIADKFCLRTLTLKLHRDSISFSGCEVKAQGWRRFPSFWAETFSTNLSIPSLSRELVLMDKSLRILRVKRADISLAYTA
ncbi:hypothetical protein [Roseivirga sp. E12]|uniref:hypothetical protein n=1 Tax=Roseivirga sp. E12 TaxID=2819237 RepID=UPI001ABC398F|nr:hypothetical protein [Roseivirga sp. E12]MBO3698258.1 hypothetical protein [Roseivirga sp. E12]